MSSQVLQRNSYSGTFDTIAGPGHQDDVQFTEDAVEGIIDGRITLTFRNWARAQPRVGSRHRVWGQLIEIERREQDSLMDERRAEIQQRLDRMDRSGSGRAWTSGVLRLIATYPGVVSATLARQMGRDRAAFKTDVRKLKELGLTESLEVGYRLSPLGRAFIGTVEREA